MHALLLAALSQPLLPTTEAPPTRCADAASTASLAAAAHVACDGLATTTAAATAAAATAAAAAASASAPRSHNLRNFPFIMDVHLYTPS